MQVTWRKWREKQMPRGTSDAKDVTQKMQKMQVTRLNCRVTQVTWREWRDASGVTRVAWREWRDASGEGRVRWISFKYEVFPAVIERLARRRGQS
jgi:hypothetical protein